MIREVAIGHLSHSDVPHQISYRGLSKTTTETECHQSVVYRREAH